MTDIQVEILNIIQSHFTVIILFFMGYISKYNIKRFPFMITDRFTKQNSSLIVIAFTVILIYSLYNFMVTGFIVILFLLFWGGGGKFKDLLQSKSNTNHVYKTATYKIILCKNFIINNIHVCFKVQVYCKCQF